MIAEFLGTFWLVFVGGGVAVFASGYPELGFGFAGGDLRFYKFCFCNLSMIRFNFPSNVTSPIIFNKDLSICFSHSW